MFMNEELEILKLADYSELIKEGDANAYLIINSKIIDHPCLFGFINLSKDFNTTKKLFDQIEKRAREIGYKEIIGPINYCTWFSYRLALDCYDIKLYPDCNNPRYYVDYLEKLGYREFLTYRSARVKNRNPLYEVGKKSFEEKQSQGFIFKHYEGDKALEKVHDIYEISCDAFKNAFLYSDLPFEFFEKIYLTWIRKIDAQLFIVYKDNQAIGFALGYKNPFMNNFISKTSAVKTEYQNQQVFAALLYYGTGFVEKMGFDDMIYHFQCEQKPDFKRFDKKYESDEKRYALFRKELGDEVAE